MKFRGEKKMKFFLEENIKRMGHRRNVRKI